MNKIIEKTYVNILNYSILNGLKIKFTKKIQNFFQNEILLFSAF